MSVEANVEHINWQYNLNTRGDFDFSFYFSDKQCHEQLWQKIAELIPKYINYYKYPSTYKELALDLLGFHEEVSNNCYACNVATVKYEVICSRCPLIRNNCYGLGWFDFSDGIYKQNLELALKGAKALANAWREGDE